MSDIDSAIRAVRMHLSDWVADAVEAERARLREFVKYVAEEYAIDPVLQERARNALRETT